jgi:uncharacterized membrane protein
MTNPNLFPACLTIHLMALTVFAGITLVDYLAHLSLYNAIAQNKRPEALLNLMARLPRLAGIGAALLILSGFGMFGLAHGIFGEQLWFRIKLGLVVLIILNSLLIGRKQNGKLQKIFATGGSLNMSAEILMIKSRLNLFYLLQLLLFVLIIFLSAFKFN